MQYKVLKHKRLEETFGVFHAGDNSEIWHSTTQTLLGKDSTMEYLKQINKGTMAYEQLDAYELVNIKIEILN